MVFGVQKVGFCIAKVWFLFFKRVFFVLQYIIPCPRNTHKMALRFSTVGIAMPLFLFIVPHISPRPPRRRRGRFIVPVPTNTPQNGIAYSHCWRCNTSYRTHVIPRNGIAIHHATPPNTHKMALRWCYLAI